MHRRSLIVVASSTWLLSLASLLTSVLRGKVSAVYLHAEGVGLVGQLNSISLLGGSIAVLGVGTAAIQLIARSRAQGREEDGQALSRFVIGAPLIVSVALTAILCAVSPPIAGLLLNDRGRWPELIVALLSIPLNVLVGCVSIVLTARGDAVRAAVASLVALPINTLIVIGGVMWFGLTGAVAGILLTSLVPALIFLLREWNLVGGALGNIRIPRVLVGEVWRLGSASFLLGTASSLMDSSLRGILVHAGGMAEAGRYQVLSVASNQAFLQASNGVMAYLGPGLAAAIAISRRNARLEMDRALRLLVSVVIMGAWTCSAFAEPIVAALFSPDFAPAARALRLQSAGEIMRACAYVLGGILLPLHMKRAWLLIGLATLATQGGIVFACATRLHLLAVPIGFGAAWIMNCSFSLAIAFRNGLAPRVQVAGATLLGFVAVAMLGISARPSIEFRGLSGIACLFAICWLVYPELGRYRSRPRGEVL